MERQYTLLERDRLEWTNCPARQSVQIVYPLYHLILGNQQEKKTVADHWLRGLLQWFNLKADVHNYPLMFIVI